MTEVHHEKKFHIRLCFSIFVLIESSFILGYWVREDNDVAEIYETLVKVGFIHIRLKCWNIHIVAFQINNSETMLVQNSFHAFYRGIIPSKIEYWHWFLIRRREIKSSDTLSQFSICPQFPFIEALPPTGSMTQCDIRSSSINLLKPSGNFTYQQV
jgi:hypothetical protein